MSTYRVTTHGEPDHLGRVAWTLEWLETDGEYRPEPHPMDGCGAPVGYRRAQCYWSRPDEVVEHLRSRGHEVVVDGEVELLDFLDAA